MKLSTDIKNQILNIIFKHLNPKETSVFLFGSQVENNAPGKSDIDIGIIGKHRIDDHIFLALSDELNSNIDTLRKIDVVDFNTVGQNFKEIALKKIEKWHTATDSKEILKI